MTRGTALVALLLACVGSGCSCSSELLQRMDAQDKNLPYGDNPRFEDGRAMRPLIPGTVAREMAPASLVRPQVTRALLERGRKRFDITCAACHGELGNGDSIVARKMALRPPPSLHDYAARPDAFFFTVISEGYGLMAPYPEIPPEERWAVVAYVRALQLSQHAWLEQAPPEARAQLLREPP